MEWEPVGRGQSDVGGKLKESPGKSRLKGSLDMAEMIPIYRGFPCSLEPRVSRKKETEVEGEIILSWDG